MEKIEGRRDGLICYFRPDLKQAQSYLNSALLRTDQAAAWS